MRMIPEPDRLGLGGQGSWAGPAWLEGPRVLGRTGLAWGAKGPGPGRLGFGLGGQGSWAGLVWVWLHFQNVQYLIVFSLKNQRHI